MVGRSTTDNLTNKTLTTPVISQLSSASSTALTLQSAGTTAITVDTSQNVGIGTSSPSEKFEVSGTVVASGLNARITNTDTDASARAAIQFKTGASSNVWQTFAINGNLTTGVAGVANYMTLDSSGNLLLGVASSPLTATQVLYFDGQNRQGLLIKNTANSSNGAAIRFMDYLGNASTGGIYYSLSNSILYSTSSDYRLKENVAPISGALEKVQALKPISFSWKQGGGNADGFLAHELQQIFPNAVHGTKDDEDAEGKPRYQGVDTSYLVATLTAAIQELKAINDTQAETINALTARITALENA